MPRQVDFLPPARGAGMVSAKRVSSGVNEVKTNRFRNSSLYFRSHANNGATSIAVCRACTNEDSNAKPGKNLDLEAFVGGGLRSGGDCLKNLTVSSGVRAAETQGRAA
jgi:hypothetical protein